MPGLWARAAIDDREQREKRDELLVPGFYRKFFPGRFILLDDGRMAELMQVELGLDTLVWDELAGVVGIQEKIISKEHRSFFLETMSCTVPGHEKDGWMKTSRADKLLYCFITKAGGLDGWLIDLERLRDWFWPREETFHRHRMEGEEHPNHSEGRLVAVADVIAAVPACERICCPRP